MRKNKSIWWACARALEQMIWFATLQFAAHGTHANATISGQWLASNVISEPNKWSVLASIQSSKSQIPCDYFTDCRFTPMCQSQEGKCANDAWPKIYSIHFDAGCCCCSCCCRFFFHKTSFEFEEDGINRGRLLSRVNKKKYFFFRSFLCVFKLANIDSTEMNSQVLL